MNQTLFYVGGITITTWKLIGFSGAILFSGRWCVQIFASHVAKKSVVPKLFWYMSITGNLLILLYFLFGRMDSVGIVSNLFPMFVASYNLFLVYKEKRTEKSDNTDTKNDITL